MRQPTSLSWLLVLAIALSAVGACFTWSGHSDAIYSDREGGYVSYFSYSSYEIAVPAFTTNVSIAYRRVWASMRGGRFASSSLGRKKRRSEEYYSGGAHDVAMFLWTQLCISGFPPHPGPTESNSSGTEAPLRVTAAQGGTAASTRGISLFDVFSRINPVSSDPQLSKKNLKRIKNMPEWLTSLLGRKSHFEMAMNIKNPSGATGVVGFTSPALHSLTELHDFIQFVYGVYSRFQKKGFEVQHKVERFFKDHKALLAELWPDESEITPTRLINPSACPAPNEQQTITQSIQNSRCFPTSASAMNNVSISMGISVTASPTVTGCFSCSVPLNQIQQFVDLVGIYSCTKFVRNNSPRKQTHIRIRYQCFRGVPHNNKASGVGHGENTQPTKRDSKVTKCACLAEITGNYKINVAKSDATRLVTLLLDLRHVGHEPGTTADARLLPLLGEVKKKMDDITCLFRNFNLIRSYLERWVRHEFLPDRHPRYKQAIRR